LILYDCKSHHPGHHPEGYPEKKELHPFHGKNY